MTSPIIIFVASCCLLDSRRFPRLAEKAGYDEESFPSFSATFTAIAVHISILSLFRNKELHRRNAALAAGWLLALALGFVNGEWMPMATRNHLVTLQMEAVLTEKLCKCTQCERIVELRIPAMHSTAKGQGGSCAVLARCTRRPCA